MKFFQGQTEPVLTVIMNGVCSVEGALTMIEEGLTQGAEAFCLQLEKFPAAERGYASYKRIFDAMAGRPAYICCYRRGNVIEEQPEEQLAEELLLAQSAGAALLDVRTDMFCPSPREITTDPEAVEKQKKLIDEIHRAGSEVLMSSHVLAYTPPEEVLALAKMQKERGADVCKIVCAADTPAQLDDAFLTSALLHRELHHRTLFLVGGEFHHNHRYLAPFLGDSIYLCTVQSNPGLQPPLPLVTALRDSLGEYKKQ